VSPLGKYAAPAAAFASVGIIAVYLLALVFSRAWGVPPEALSQLDNLAFLAAGALFGSAVAVNGYKAPVAAAHKRLDAIHAPPAADLGDGGNG
jgi:hypothetical protein